MRFVCRDDNYIADDKSTYLLSQTKHYHNGSLVRQTQVRRHDYDGTG